LYWCALGFWAVLCAGCFNPVGREAPDTGDRDEAGLTETEEGANTFVVRFTIGDGPRAVALEGNISDDDPRQVQRFLSNYAQLMVLDATDGSIAWFGEAQKPNNTFMLTRFNGFVFDKKYRFFLVQGGKAGTEPPTLLAAGLSKETFIPSHAVTEIEITMHCIDVKPSFISGDETAPVENGVFQLAPGKTWQAVWKIRGLDGLGEFKVPDSIAISGGNAEVPGKADLSNFQFNGTSVTADIAVLQGAAYFNLLYKPLNLTDDKWQEGFPGAPKIPPEWIIRNGLNDEPQDGNTDFLALAGGDISKNGNGAVRFDRSLWITKPLKTPINNTTNAKVGFTLSHAGMVYYAVVNKNSPGAPSAYTTFAGPYTGPGTYEITLTMSDTQDAVWLMLMDASSGTEVRSKPVEASGMLKNPDEAEAYLNRAQVGKEAADPPVYLPISFTDGAKDLILNVEDLILNKEMKYVDVGLPAGSFYNNDNLTSVSSLEVTEIADGTQGSGAFRDCDKLETVDLPNVTYIGNFAFDNCDKLKTVNIPKAQTIGEVAFWHCALTTLYIPEVTSIGREAFDSCAALIMLYIPKVTRIDYDAFYLCTALTTLYLGETPPTFGTNVFGASGNGPLTIYVPTETAKSNYDTWLLTNKDIFGPRKDSIVIQVGTYQPNP
jgi:hypothetical protein